jgi:glycosyltransferase involved in cell wall biosynthesis
MHICIVIDAKIPVLHYGGTERFVIWLGRALVARGHKVTFLAKAGSTCEFATVLPLDVCKPLDSQIPPDVDIVHMNTELAWPEKLPACQTIHGNTRESRTFHPNTIFVSQNHAVQHGGKAFVCHGLDPLEYGPPTLDQPGRSFVFLGKAAWRLKNVRGAIRVARKAGAPIDILGGTRINLSMGLRITLDPNARFHGMVGGEAKNALLRQSRGLIFPVLWNEPGAIAVIESLYFGLPVFATPYGCVPELVPEQAGCLSASASDLAEAARDLARFDRRAIHAWWSEQFTSDHMAIKYLMYYEQILSGENLHPEILKSPATRSKQLLDWFE